MVIYGQAFPGAKWSERKALWTFPSGARIWMTYLEQDKDVLRYQGQSFTWIGVDELTQYASPYAWNYLRSRLRTVDNDLPTLDDKEGNLFLYAAYDSIYVDSLGNTQTMYLAKVLDLFEVHNLPSNVIYQNLILKVHFLLLL